MSEGQGHLLSCCGQLKMKPDREENKAKLIPALFADVFVLAVAVAEVPEQTGWF